MMSDSFSIPRILFPLSINEALGMAYREPQAHYWAGGTAFMAESRLHPPMSLPVLIAISRIEELSRVYRTDQTLEIGTMTTLEKLITVGSLSLPPVLPKAISGIGTQPLRNQATVGGHLAQQNSFGDIRPLLHILDSKFDIRYHKERRGKIVPIIESRKVSLTELNEYLETPGRNVLITRASIPTKHWDMSHYEKIYPLGNANSPLIFSAVARVDKNTITEFHMALYTSSSGILRDTELEADMTGRSLPLSKRELQLLRIAVSKATESWDNHSFQRKVALNLSERFFTRALV